MKVIKQNVGIDVSKETLAVCIVMMYENLAYFLYAQNEIIHVVLPIRAKRYAESLPGDSKTDKLDAKALGRMGVERKLDVWQIENLEKRECPYTKSSIFPGLQMLRLSFLSAFLRSKNIVGERTPTIQDRLQFKALTKAFFQLMSKLINFV